MNMKSLLDLAPPVLGAFAVLMSGASAQDAPVYGASDLKLDTSRLRPHRLLYDPRDGVGGYENGLFTDGVYEKPQVSITLDRTVYYSEEGRARDAIRVRWVANTHPHVDELVVDAVTLGAVNERTRAGKNWQTRDEILYVRGGVARVIALSDDAAPELTTFALQHEQHYGLMILPYLFASMDVPDGSEFRLPAIGSDGEGFINVKVVGPSAFVDAENSEQEGLLVTSTHGWGEIDWYVSKDRPPYHLHAVWRFNLDGSDSPSAVSKVIDWVVFDADIYDGVVNDAALKN